jgi:hypothetical protein
MVEGSSVHELHNPTAAAWVEGGGEVSWHYIERAHVLPWQPGMHTTPSQG